MSKKLLIVLTALFTSFALLPAGVNAEEKPYEEATQEMIKEVPESQELPHSELPMESAEANAADEERSLEGKAYAVLTDEGDFIFFRSTNDYTNEEKTEAVDLFGNKYSGTVFAVDETSECLDDPASVEWAPWGKPWAEIKYNELVNTVRVAEKQKIKPKRMCMWFYRFNNLKSIDLHGLDSSECGAMDSLFAGCSSLKNLDVSTLDTSNVTNMENMFDGCSSLENLDVSTFDTSNVTNMNKMFDYCLSLKTLNLGNINTENVTKFTWCFAECESLESLDISCLDTGNATELDGMFAYDSNLKQIDVSNFDTSSCTDMSGMFYGCSSLEELDLSGFVTNKVTSFARMFKDSTNLKYLDISSFDTSAIEPFPAVGAIDKMCWMFDNLRSLEAIRLGKKMVRWEGENYPSCLPEGTWINKALNLSLTSEELQKQYPANAEQWAGLWEKDKVHPTGVTLDQTSCSITAGQSLTLQATVSPEDAENKKVLWESDNEKVATVDANGTVTGVSAGTANIKAVTEDGSYEAVCSVRVLFTDVADSKQYFYEPVYWAVDNGITVGAGGPGKFSPSASCTREQFVTFLWRQKGQPKAEKGCDFADVPKDAWYYEPISWAAEKGITTGLNDGTNRFGVGQACTREQCVTFLHRAAGSPEPEGSIEFTDSPKGRYYYKAIKWAAGKGITVGLNDGTGRFGVGQKCTRGMLVTFLYRSAHAE